MTDLFDRIEDNIEQNPFTVLVWILAIGLVLTPLLLLVLDVFFLQRGFDYYANQSFRFYISAFCVSIFLLFCAVMAIRIGRKNMSAHGTARWARLNEIKRFGDDCGVVIGGVGLVYNKSRKYLKRGFYIFYNGASHVLLVAKTRAGKSVAYVLPTLFSWNGSAIIFDLKTELYMRTAGARKKHAGREDPSNFWHVKNKKYSGEHTGSDILVFYPNCKNRTVDSRGYKKSCGFNPLQYISLGSQNESKDINNLVEMIVDAHISKGDGNSSGASGHFRDMCIFILRGAFIHTLYENRLHSATGKITQNDIDSGEMRFTTDDGKPLKTADGALYPIPCLSDIFFNINYVEGLVAKLLDDENKGENSSVRDCFKSWYAVNHVDAFQYPHLSWWGHSKTHPYINELSTTLLGTSYRELSAALNTIRRAMDMFSLPNVHFNTTLNFTNDGGTWHIKDLMDGEKPLTIYLVVKEDDIETIGPILTIFVQIVARYYMQNPNQKRRWRCLCVIDEFPAWGKFSFLERTISTIASTGMMFYLIMQFKESIDKLYGENSALHANTDIKLFMSNKSDKTNEYVSKECGEKTVKLKTTSRSTRLGHHNSSSSNSSFIRRRLITPDEVSRIKKLNPKKMKVGEAILFYEEDFPAKTVTPIYFCDRLWSEWAKIPPPFDIGVTDQFVETGDDLDDDIFNDDSLASLDKSNPTDVSIPPGNTGNVSFHDAAEISFMRKYNAMSDDSRNEPPPLDFDVIESQAAMENSRIASYPDPE